MGEENSGQSWAPRHNCCDNLTLFFKVKHFSPVTLPRNIVMPGYIAAFRNVKNLLHIQLLIKHVENGKSVSVEIVTLGKLSL